MVPPNPTLDALETVSKRADVLAALEGEPRRKRDLVETLSVSRSTVDRAIRELEAIEFVEREAGRYRLTVAGRLALEEHRRRVDALESITAVSGLLGHVPREAPMSVAFLDGASVSEPEPHAPNEPYEMIVDRIERAARVRGLVAADRTPRVRGRLRERAVDGCLDGELIVTDELATFLFEHHTRQMRELAREGGFDLYATGTVPYGLWIADGDARSEAFVVVHGDSADVRGVIRNDSRRALEWAREVYRRFRERARPLDPAGNR